MINYFLFKYTMFSLLLQSLGTPLFAQLYHPHDPPFDPNAVILVLIAVLTVVIGAYWSGHNLQKRCVVRIHIKIKIEFTRSSA